MLVTTELTKNLGQLKYGKPHNFSIFVRNAGESNLEITRVLLGCQSCTTAYATKSLLSPNEEAEVKVTFTPGSVGEHNKHISIQWNNDNTLKVNYIATAYD